MDDAEFMIKKGMFLNLLGNMFIKTGRSGIDFESLIIWAGLEYAANKALEDLKKDGITYEEIQHYRKLNI